MLAFPFTLAGCRRWVEDSSLSVLRAPADSKVPLLVVFWEIYFPLTDFKTFLKFACRPLKVRFFFKSAPLGNTLDLVPVKDIFSFELKRFFFCS